VHIVAAELAVKLGREDELGTVVGIEPVVSCCGLIFEPSTVEVVSWGTAVPHEVCALKSGYPRSFVSRVSQEARDSALRRDASDEDMDASVQTMATLLAARGRDWVCDEHGDSWTYEASFNGVFPGDRLYPRYRDIGLERLEVWVPYPGAVHIQACGVRDGCSRHVARIETFSLDHLATVDSRISSHEIAATSIQLMELAWCLITGHCSAVPVYEPNDPISLPEIGS
jgi:hypothetical protein